MFRKQPIKIVTSLMTVGLLMLLTMQVNAYSYSEAGKEPLIEGREALTGALLVNDTQAALSALEGFKSELIELEAEQSIKVYNRLKEAVKKNDRIAVIHLMNTVFAEEIKRRLNSAEQNINDYQKSKILVAKSKRFLNTIIVELDDDEADTASQSITRCLKALGNPGVFGAGAIPADLARFKSSKQALFSALSAFE